MKIVIYLNFLCFVITVEIETPVEVTPTTPNVYTPELMGKRPKHDPPLYRYKVNPHTYAGHRCADLREVEQAV